MHMQTLAWMKACSCSSSLVLCSTMPRYWRMVVSVTPAWPPSRSVMAVGSQPILLKTESTPVWAQGVWFMSVGVSIRHTLYIIQ